MLDKNQHIAPDIEWILQSGQANEQMLLETLVHDYAGRLYRFCLAVLEDADLSRQITGSICAKAVRQAQDYKPQDGVDFWLANIAIKEMRRAGPSNDPQPEPKQNALQALTRQEKIILFLTVTAGWQPQQTTRASDANPATIQATLEKACVLLCSTCNKNDLLDDLHAVLEINWPPAKFSEIEIETLLGVAQAKIKPAQSWRKLFLGYRESIVIALVIALLAGLTWGINRLAADDGAPETALAMQLLPSTRNQPPAEPFVYTVQAGDELADIAARLELSLDDLTGLNSLQSTSKISSGQQLLVIPGRNRPDIGSRADPQPTQEATSLFSIIKPGSPLHKQSTVQEVLDAWKNSETAWQQLFLEAQWIDYGPASYLGPLRMERFQAWIERPGSSLVRSGALDSLPDQTHLVVDGEVYQRSGGEKTSISWWDINTDSLIPDARLEPVIHAMKVLDEIALESLVITGEEVIADRSTIILQGNHRHASSIFRLWIDKKTGLLLRKQEISTQGQLILSDLIVTQILIEPGFSPSATFDLARIDPPLFAANYHQPFTPQQDALNRVTPAVELAVRATHSFPPAPQDFTPAASRLTFVFPEKVEDSQNQQRYAHILADGYDLGETKLGPYWQIQCRRSPDGTFLAFWQNPEKPATGEYGIHWLSLTQPEQVFHSMADFQVMDFAFSADGRTLAVFARQVLSSTSSLFLLDFATGAQQRIADLTTAQYLAWKPDGSSISLLGSEPGKNTKQWMILHKETGLFTFRSLSRPGSGADVGTALQVSHLGPPVDYPAWSWGVELTPQTPGLDGCAERNQQ